MGLALANRLNKRLQPGIAGIEWQAMRHMVAILAQRAPVVELVRRITTRIDQHHALQVTATRAQHAQKLEHAQTGQRTGTTT
ncbi:hypothetical protein D3C78_1854070 [compost metagenome]